MSDWLHLLKSHSEQHPIAVLRFTEDEWDALLNSKRGTNEFTVARNYSLVRDIKPPCACLLLGGIKGEDQALFGLISTKKSITTLESRIKISRAMGITPVNAKKIAELVSEKPHSANLKSRLVDSNDLVTALTPKLSSHLIEKLAAIKANQDGMRIVAESLSAPKRFSDNAAIQEDAIQTALAAFGLSSNDKAFTVELVRDKPTALMRVPIREDSVIDHDARIVPDYSLIKSDLTGRAVFQKGGEQLEVITANIRKLEDCLGVDLIYVNLTQQNVVMLQYKMLEPASKTEQTADWTYKPDGQLDAQIDRMKQFSATHAPTKSEFRLNPQVFYMKFVKRDALLKNGSIIMPLDHFEKIRSSDQFKGPRGGLRLSYDALNGQYLRQSPFLDLVKAGYIGSHVKTTALLTTLIEEILKGNRAVIAAIQKLVDT